MQGGESLLDLQARFMPFVEQLLSRHRAAGGGLVLVSHGGVYENMLPRLLKNVNMTAADRYSIPHTGVIIAEDTPAGLICESWCGVPAQRLDDSSPPA
jgi:broad specificity phosphatase PhoE